VTGITAGLVVVLAAAGIAVATTGGSGDPAQIAIGIRDGGDTPDGWTRTELEHGTSIAVPPEWDLVQFVFVYPGPLGAVGTGAPGVYKVTACETAETTPTVAGTWVALYEIPQEAPGAPVILPGGSEVSDGVFPDRPTTFSPQSAYEAHECSSGGDSGVSLSRWETHLFRDDGRLFVALVVVTDPQSSSTEMAHRVLDTFRVGEQTVTVPPMVHEGTIPPTVATTLPPPTVPAYASPDELAIRDVYMHLIGQVPRDAIGDYVEDYDSIADSWRAGMAQNSEDTQSRYVMRVDSVALLDDTHATVHYTLLFDGRPRFANLAGGAVKIDGRWYITRETVCSLLTNGGITCPARTTPIP